MRPEYFPAYNSRKLSVVRMDYANEGIFCAKSMGRGEVP